MLMNPFITPKSPLMPLCHPIVPPSSSQATTGLLSFFLFFLKKILFIFRERGREREREGEKHQCVAASRTPSTGDSAHNPGMSPDWE